MVEKVGLYWHFVDLGVGIRIYILLSGLTHINFVSKMAHSHSEEPTVVTVLPPDKELGSKSSGTVAAILRNHHLAIEFAVAFMGFRMK
jgi:hypothetical protein